MSFPDRRLYLLFTPSLCALDPWTTLDEALAGGVDLVQWRVRIPDLDGFMRCRERCDRVGVPLIVNDDVMLAVRGRAHGAHVGQEDTPANAARRLLDGQWLGVSTHDETQIDAATAAGADYVGFGPCFPTATKGYTRGTPPERIAAAVEHCRLPLYAIGGITAENLVSLRLLGVDRIAVSASILTAPDPQAAAQSLRRLL